MYTIKPNDILKDFIKYEETKKACNIPQAEIDKKVAEIFPQEKVDKIKAEALKGIDDILKGATL